MCVRAIGVHAIVVLLAFVACTPSPMLVPQQGGQVALASEGGISMVADATAWGDQWDVDETLTPIAVDIRNGSKRKVLVRGQDMVLLDETGRRYEVFPLGVRQQSGSSRTQANPPAQPPAKSEPKDDGAKNLPDEPPPTPPARPKDMKGSPDKGGGTMNIDGSEDGLDVIFAANAPPRPPPGGGGGFSPRPSAPPQYGGGSRAPAYRAPSPSYRAPAPYRYSTPRYYGPRSYYGGWGWGWGGGYYGPWGYGYWDPYWGSYWGPRYGYGYYLYRPWPYARPADDILGGMVRVALLDATLDPQQSARGFVFFQYALDSARTLTLRWTPRDGETDEALPALQTVFHVDRG